jgi:3-oxoacyl-(acyl-carrier-protein) synthase
MDAAMMVAGLGPGDIGYVNAHGTGMPEGDRSESEAMRDVFCSPDQPLVSSTKPATGHCLGAAGAIELAITIAALKRGEAPRTLNMIDPGDGCWPVLAEQHRDGLICRRYAMSNSLAFGGLNVSLIVKDIQP